jgi:hypothetical protein
MLELGCEISDLVQTLEAWKLSNIELSALLIS